MAGCAEHCHTFCDLALAGGAKANKHGAGLDLDLLDSKVSAPNPQGDHQSLCALRSEVEADPFIIAPHPGNGLKE